MFNVLYFGITSASMSAAVCRSYEYNASMVPDTLETVEGTGYFNQKLLTLNIGDRIFVYASDGARQYLVTSVTTNVTIVQFTNLGANGQNVPSQTIYDQIVSWSGSGASLAVTLTNILATDHVQATIVGLPTQGGALVGAVPTTGTLTLHLATANTSNDGKISILVTRPVTN